MHTVPSLREVDQPAMVTGNDSVTSVTEPASLSSLNFSSSESENLVASLIGFYT